MIRLMAAVAVGISLAAGGAHATANLLNSTPSDTSVYPDAGN